MADLVLETPEGVALRFELAGAGTRILAAAIDGLLFGLGFLVSLLGLQLAGLAPVVSWLVSGAVVLLVAYSFLFSWMLDGRTPGKLWTGIRVSDAQGFAPTRVQLFMRALFVPLEAVLVLPVPLVWILIALTPLHQRLGDMVAGTLVLRERPRRAPRDPVPELTWSGLARRDFALDPPMVRALGGADLGLLRDLLTRADLAPRARERLFVHAAEQYAARVGLEREFTPGEAQGFLRELFLLLREVRNGGITGLPASPRAAAASRDTPPASGPPLP